MTTKAEKKELPDDLYLQTILLAKVVERILQRRTDLELSTAPTWEKKPITEFVKRMRINGLSKFDVRCYISTINFYKTNEDLQNHKAIGAIILYIPETFVVKLMSELHYPSLIAHQMKPSSIFSLH